MSGPRHDQPEGSSGFYIIEPDAAADGPREVRPAGDRQPPALRHRHGESKVRRWALLGVITVLSFAAGTAVGSHLGADSATTAAVGTSSSAAVNPTASTRAGTSRTTTSAPSAAPSRSGAAELTGPATRGTGSPSGLTGATLGPGTQIGTRLYLRSNSPADNGVLAYDVDAHQTLGIPGLPSGISAWMDVVPIDGGVAVTAPPTGQSTYGPAVLYIVRGDQVVRHFPIQGQTFPADTGDALWLAVAPDDGDGWVQEIDLTGNPMTPRYSLPSGRIVIRGTVAGLLTATEGVSDRVQLWNPVTATVERSFGQYVAADGTRLAWIDTDCRPGDCPLHVTELAGGDTTTLVDVSGAVPFSGVLSPTQNPPRLALIADHDGTGEANNEAAVQQVVQIDLTTGAATRVPGLELSPAADATLAWSPDGRWLLVAADHKGDSSGALAAWAPGSPQIELATTDLPATTIVTATDNS